VARDAREIGGVNEELALGDADGQDVGDVLVGDGVAVAVPLDEPPSNPSSLMISKTRCAVMLG
jgi:hypothetical protein